nr:MAG TPA: hypothetical protein [Bacteriophage sp.]
MRLFNYYYNNIELTICQCLKNINMICDTLTMCRRWCMLNGAVKR